MPLTKAVSTLILELETYQSTDADENSDVEETLRLLREAATPDVRSHYAPGHITASAFVIDPETAKILLHHHRRLDRWLQLGGHLDAGETARQAAMREAKEESGIEDLWFYRDEIFDVDVHLIPSGRNEPEHRHFDIRFLLAANSDHAVTRDDAESLDLKWFSLAEGEEKLGPEEGHRVLGKIRAAIEYVPSFKPARERKTV